jgi:hypothetical protein
MPIFLVFLLKITAGTMKANRNVNRIMGANSGIVGEGSVLFMGVVVGVGALVGIGRIVN